MERPMRNGGLSLGSSAENLAAVCHDSSSSSHSHGQIRYDLQAMQLLQEGRFLDASHCLNLCLGDKNDIQVADLEAQLEDLTKDKPISAPCKPLDSTEYTLDKSSLIEKRCLVNMKLKRYNEVVHDAKLMLEISPENSVAYKCLLGALCKMKKLEQANEIIRLWQKTCPRVLEMMECRTKLESLMVAVKNGIEASDAFSDVEELLGLNYDWLLLRKSKDPQWKFRPLPASSSCSFVLCLQYRYGHCSLGEKCPDAHGGGELEEWKKRFDIENITRKISTLKMDDGAAYIKELLAKTHGKSTFIENDRDHLNVSCITPVRTTVQQRKFKKFIWKFTVKTSKPLTHICLLHEHHRQYFHISSCSFVGPKESVTLNQTGKMETSSQVVTPHLSEAALAIAGSNKNSYHYKVKVVFMPEVFGNFRQTVVFDIGNDPKVARHLTVDVVPPIDSDKESNKGLSDRSVSPVDKGTYRTNVPWNFGNANVVDSKTGEKMASEKLGFVLIPSATVVKQESFKENTKDPLSKDHYKERIRFLLTQEERSRQEIIAKYNVTTNVQLSSTYSVASSKLGERYAIDGSLFGRMSLFRDISEDTAVGRLILRSCSAVLVAKSEESRKKQKRANKKLKAFFCTVCEKTKNVVYLDIGKNCTKSLGLKSGDVVQFDIQFQLDRTSFIEQKKVIDQLEERHLKMLFPDLNITCHIPWSPIMQWSEDENSEYRLNPKQKEALIAITAENCKTPPILVIGPFGTGKTFTLAQCIRKILTQKDTRVMVCTHSNSAADLYIKEYLDPWVKEGFTDARPLRIYYEMRNLYSVHPTVQQYCTIAALKFRPPTYEEVMAHRVIVVTLSTSYVLMELDLPENTFSHILLDEAAQAMESEAITPLMSAGPNTKLVLAGDHMQLSPELFSDEARNIHPSLLERLHALYPDSHPCKLMLCENYRSHSAIIQFVSDSFYTKKLECAKGQPVHDNFYPLTFYAARGEDVQELESTSYYNMAEVYEVTEKICELISSWPAKWGDFRDENAIGVLTPYADQVSRIRNRLRTKGLHSVSVERVFNVQGKQFRAVFLSTVRSFRPWVRILPESIGNEVDLGFFSSPKLLNTALTRAQSLVAVVGDPVSLCAVGKCRRIWEDYIRICHENKSLLGITFLQLKQSILGVEMRLTWGLNPLANEFQPHAKKLTAPPVVPVVTTVPPVNPQFANPYSTQYLRRPRAPLFIGDPNAGYYAPPHHFPEVYPLIHPQAQIPNHPFPGHHQLVPLRQPYIGSNGMIHPFPAFVPPVTPWGPGLPVQMHHHLAQNQVWPNPTPAAPPPLAVGRTGVQRPPYPTTPTLNYPNQPAPATSNTTEYIPKPNNIVPSAAPTIPPLMPTHSTVNPTIPPLMPPHSTVNPTIPPLMAPHSTVNPTIPPLMAPHSTVNPTIPPLMAPHSTVNPTHAPVATTDTFNGSVSRTVPTKMPVSSTTHSHYATGYPLFHRPVAQSMQITNTQQHLEDYSGSGQQYPVYEQLLQQQPPPPQQQQQPPPPQQQQPQHQQTQQKLTHEELSIISRALEHHAATGEFYGDSSFQNLRAKLMQAVDPGAMARPVAAAQPISTSTSYPEIHSMDNYSQNQQFLSSSNTANSSSINNGLTASASMPLQIPQTSPAIPSEPYLYNNVYQDPSGATQVPSRIWATSNGQGVPFPNEGANSIGATSGVHQQLPSLVPSADSSMNRIRSGYLDPNPLGPYQNPTNNSINGSLNTMSMPQGQVHQTLPSRPSSFNNNSVMSHYEYGYQTDGLKAQLSGGIRQGFGERSAFSKVNGGQDVDVVSDSLGLGRSYANVVKAAVTAAVGAGVSTPTFSMSSNIQRMPAPTPVSANSFPSKFYSAASAPSRAHYGP